MKKTIKFNEEDLEKMGFDFEDFVETLSDEISNKTGFCHKGFTFEVIVEADLDVDTEFYDFKAFFFDLNEDPTTPFEEELFSVEAEDEDTAKEKATAMAYNSKNAVGQNISVEIEAV